MKRLYVNIPSNIEAGGVESLYQLVDAINNVGGNASIIWDAYKTVPCFIPPRYQKYNIKVNDVIQDKDSLVIYPEVWTDKLNTFPGVQKAIWWLSVNNNNYSFKNWSDPEIIHFCQSFYAVDYVTKNNCVKHFYLNDYISDTYTNLETNILNKENIVVYNPAKGIENTNKIISSMPETTFIPIANLSEKDVLALFQRAKVYIDFGHHPGRDRMPREAAALKCCVITNDQGSAFYYDDVLIPDKYKVNTNTAKDIINECFEQYENSLNEQENYRKEIFSQKQQLHDICKKLFL